MVRILGILGGILLGWYAHEMDQETIFIAGIVLTGILTAMNLKIALRQFLASPYTSSDQALMDAIRYSPGDRLLENIQGTIEESRAARSGHVLPRTIIRYLVLCFIVNAATIAVVAYLTYLIT
jgi:hypothetical protein